MIWTFPNPDPAEGFRACGPWGVGPVRTTEERAHRDLVGRRGCVEPVSAEEPDEQRDSDNQDRLFRDMGGDLGL